MFGVVETPDSPTYLAYAMQLVPGPRPEGAALLAEGPMPVTLYRTIGYPAVLVALQSISPAGWPMLQRRRDDPRRGSLFVAWLGCAALVALRARRRTAA
ncbi:hypothetical protein J5Y09_09570 [Roseomonas sp. PWR1]|uniref:Uncharacterized protein n=1 Tax=Roseomonas nitratireducens TaxID=2820810 RepID=A0ABS4ASD6_9PROT|nr:hypothetical protein [Neoroseomonas nitratireducens]MBP0464159.1 hypothetical protein [Neoroseomonas nitratireducens]